MILAGDIGATRVLLAAYQNEGNKLQCVVQRLYKTQDHSGIGEVLKDFVNREGVPVHAACFGVAGPVRAGKSKISNLQWTIDSRDLASRLKLASVGLLNDLEAYAYGVDALASTDFITLSEGAEDAEGNRVVISARTGLGLAGLYWDGFRHHPFACEGGHSDFAPRNDLEMELAQYLRKKFGHVSCERLLSGPGIKNIYDFLRDAKKAEEPDWLRQQISQAPDPPALISQLALEGKAAICEQALSMFVSIYGSETGNCALNFMATGGVFIGGSIAAKIVPKMQDPIFMKSFLGKGRMQSLLADMPVKVIANDNAGLMGAARYTLVQKAFSREKRAIA
ncbi:MAG TPA: glucokinase [Terriglobales bacterium]|nr:glucokinase [Terriglobales bacterium]